MIYRRLVVLVIAFEVAITVLVGLGLYFGFVLYPYAHPPIISATESADAAVQTMGLRGAIPFYMPSLKDLNIPYTSLHIGAGGQVWGWMTFLLSAGLLVLQSFIRGVYLGGLKEWELKGRMVPLLWYGRRYFGRMMAWSVFQIGIGGIVILLDLWVFPLGIILMFIVLFYSLTPYLIILQDISFAKALARAPGMLLRFFGRLLPLALLALICTFAISIFGTLTPPWGYAISLLAYSYIGTLLIGALLRRLGNYLNLPKEETGELGLNPVEGGRTNRLLSILNILLIPVLVLVGVFASLGKPMALFDYGIKEQLKGFFYMKNYSDVFYITEHNYTAYEWRSQGYSLEVKLPDFSEEQKPKELRGIAYITWQVNEERREVSGNSTHIFVEPVKRKSRLVYRLVRETAEDGSFYYSSRRGVAAILPGEERPREPLSVEMMVSGDGSQVFVLQYPSRFDVSQVFRVSDDGQFLVPGTSSMNPTDFHTYWFAEEPSKESLFQLLAAKNRLNSVPTMDRVYVALACALQEGDGETVYKLIDLIRQAGITVEAPEWDSSTWTENLRKRYEGTSIHQVMELLSHAGVQGGYIERELSDQSDNQTGVYQLHVRFPGGNVTILYKKSKADGRLLSVTVKE